MHCSFVFPKICLKSSLKRCSTKTIESGKKKGADEELKEIEELGSAENTKICRDNDESPRVLLQNKL